MTTYFVFECLDPISGYLKANGIHPASSRTFFLPVTLSGFDVRQTFIGHAKLLYKELCVIAAFSSANFNYYR
jgi:hypothetical protein